MRNLYNHNLNEVTLPDKLSSDILSDLKNKETSLGDNPAIPEKYDSSFLEKIIATEWLNAKKRLKNIGRINDVPDTELEGALSHLILECQELERPYRNELEIICSNLIASLFRIPKDTVEMSLFLVDQVNLNDDSIIVDPIDGDDSLQFDNYEDALSIKDEVYKRRFLDMLSTGAGLTFSDRLGDYAEDIYEISPKLIDLYEKILALNNYLLLSKENLDINDKETRQIGTNIVRLGSKDEIVRIEAQGKIFPVLYAETISGFMELFASHGLPDDINKARLIIGKSDFIKAEPWDMRIGPAIWNILSTRLDITETEKIPYLFKEISQLKPQTFFKFMRETLLDTKKSREWISVIQKRAERNMSEDQFLQRMNPEKQPGIISDDISPLEL